LASDDAVRGISLIAAINSIVGVPAWPSLTAMIGSLLACADRLVGITAAVVLSGCTCCISTSEPPISDRR
jgi:hypothetical protein